jgi:hypothetical protein
LAIVQATYNGDGSFTGTLQDTNGNYIGMPINGLNGYNGAQLVQIPNTGAYVINIKTDSTTSNPWTITITQPKGEQSASPPQSYNGKGDQVLGPIRLNSGMATFITSSNADGKGNFIARLYDSDGNLASGIINVKGQNSGNEAISIPSSGVYYINMIYDGSWSISVSQ